MATLDLATDRELILNAVREMYDDVAACPSKAFHFPTGRRACLFVGYQEEELDAIPSTAVESFAGVGYPFLAGVIEPGDTVVDVGSGSGVDVLVAAKKAGPEGRVLGVDITTAMIEKATENVRKAALPNVWIQEGGADDLPFEDATADVVTSNGVINLVPEKSRAFQEIRRVLRPGGRVQIADIVLSKPASAQSKANPQLWAECIVGAEPEADYLEMLREAGFDNVTVLDRLDYFAHSSNESTRKAAAGLGAHTIVVTAVRA